ncbi:MAG: NAD(P)H-dependent oxidoreductase [Ahrensia sp.]|nr:NAD(P)H-dependent oxidoreductase [Ahrensia sp.]
MATPMWWGGLPAKLKGLIDRTFLPGKTFDTRNKTAIGFPMPMLKGRTARLIVTSDTPGWLMSFCYGNALFRQIRYQIMGFVGIRPTRFTHFNMASHPKPGKVDGWIKTVSQLGAQAA